MIGAVLRETLALYAALASRLVPVAALVFAPFAAALLVLELVAPARPERELDLAVIDAVGAVLLFAPLVSIAAIRCAVAHEQGARPEVLREAGRAFDLLVPYVATQLLVLAVILALPGVLIGVGLLVGIPLLVAVGFGALLASAIVNGVRLAVATPAVVVDGGRYGAALRRSVALVRGSFLAVLGVLAVVSVLALGVGLALSALPALLPEGATRAAAGAALGVVVNAATVPLGALAAYRLYRTLAERRERSIPEA
jgi:hypothetical protein